MTLNYQKVWETMNELEMVTSKICSAREIIDVAAEAAQNHDYNRAETMASAAYEFLGYYLEEFDKKFQDAWRETVTALKQEENDAYDAVMKEKEYYEPSMPPWGHSDMEALSQYKEDKVVKWVLPVEETKIDETDETEYFITFPDDLLEAANLKEGDQIEWIDNNDGTFSLVKQ